MVNKITLIDPVFNPGIIPPHVSLGKIEAVLEKRSILFDVVDFLDLSCDDRDMTYFKDVEREFVDRASQTAASSDIVYISSSTGFELKPYPIFPRIAEVAKMIKKKNPSTRILVGGALINFLGSLNVSKEDISHGVIDDILFGDEVNSFRNALLGDKPMLLGKIREGKRPDAAIPKWKSWSREDYPPYLSILGNVGCPYKCNFCFEGGVYNRKNNNLGLDDILESIDFAVETHGIRRFAVEDSVFLSLFDPEEFCSHIGERGISWTAYARVNELIKYKELLPHLRRAGCSGLIVGIETPDEIILKEQNKGIKLNQIYEAVAAAKEADLHLEGCFMVNFPDEGVSEVRRTLEFGKGLELFTNRWHTYQPNLRTLPWFKPTDWLRVQTNVPDHLLGNLLDECPEVTLYDQHLLIRCIPYIDSHPKLDRTIFRTGLKSSELYTVLREELRGTQKFFNEEKMYEFI